MPRITTHGARVPARLARRLYWLEQRLRGRGIILDHLMALRRSQELPARLVREQQLEKLRALLVHAQRTVPYYRRVMAEAGFDAARMSELGELRKLPLLTRHLLRTEKEALRSEHADRRTLITNYSSGSTGVRAEFEQDGDFRRWMRAFQFRTYEWCNGWQIGDPFVLLWGAEIYFQNKHLIERIEHRLMNRFELNTFRITQELLSRFLATLREVRPALVSTYTNVMHLIAREAERRGIRDLGIGAIQTTSEPLTPEIRAKMREICGCEIFDKYGSREMGIICQESPRHEGMCIMAENVHVEFLREDDSPCNPGEPGRLVITQLNNRAMPLIRYEMSDLAAPLEGTCSSGIGLPRMTSVAGRQQDLIYTPRGDHIDAYFFSYLIMRFDQIHWFQVVQREVASIVLRVYAPGGLTREVAAELVERIHHHTGFELGVEFDILREMPTSATGKFRLCISELGHVPGTEALDLTTS
jgi:phenylacetate-CoA ligase